MLRLKSFIIFSVLLMSSLFNSHAADDKTDTPDFAYPQTVIEDARKALASASDGAARLRAVLEICTAEEAIDPDTIFSLPAFVESQMAAPGLTDADKAMFTAYEAQIFRNIYNNSRYKYNQVEAPLEPLPADISKWSGKQFMAKIAGLYTEAAALAAKGNAALTAYSRCLLYNDNALAYVPDVRGFIALRAFDWYRSNNEPADLLAKTDTAKDAAAFYAAGTAPWFYWQVCLDNSRDALGKLYAAYSDNEAARYVLLSLCDAQGTVMPYGYFDEEEEDETDSDAARFRRQLTADIERSLALFPDWFANSKLRNRLAELTRPTLNVSGRSKCAPRSEYEVTVKSSFVRDYSLTLYKLPARNISAKEFAKKGTRISTLRGSIAASEDTTFTVSIKVGEPGHYAIQPEISGVKPESLNAVYFEAVPILPFVVDGLDGKGVVVTDFITGAPQKASVDLNLTTWRNHKETKTVPLGATGSDGVLMFSGEDSNFWQNQALSFRYRNRTYNFDNEFSVRNFKRGETSDKGTILIFTDRPIYHPGDTIQWAVVAAKDGQALEGNTLRINIRNANGRNAGSITAVTDAYGRTSGKFVTEKDGLTGYWLLTAETDKIRNSANIMVSDFRLPTFYAEVTSVERDVPAKGAVRLSGSATTYSGMPVAGADVKIKVSGASRWRSYMPAREIATFNVTTDEAGAFSLDIPADTLSQTFDNGKPYKDFFVNITVTSPDGSTADTSRGFTTGKPYILEATAPETTVDNSSPVPVTFKAYDANGKEGTVAVRWSLRADDKADSPALLSGAATTGQETKLDLSSLGAGNYWLTVESADPALAEPQTALVFTIYNVAKGLIPADKQVFIPVRSIAAEGDKAEVLVGVNVDKAYIYSINRQGDKLNKIRLYTLPKGYSRITVDIENPDDAQLMLAWVLNGNVSSAEINITTPPVKQPEIKAESFRDRLVPGASETWRFRLLDGDGKTATDAAMIATLYNRAIEELQKRPMPVNFGFYKPSYRIWLDAINIFNSSAMLRKALKLDHTSLLVYPEFLFGRSVMLSELRIRGLGNVMVEAVTSKKYAASATVKEEAFDMNAAADFALSEEAVEESEETADAGGAEVKQEPQQFEYRTGEVLQAFWMPSLVADKDGNIDLTFTVPNANGTWSLNAFAWTKNAEAARFIGECIANKPVMVQPNLPRFLRQGDKARLLATVYNNSDNETEVTTVAEIFDVATGKVISTSTSTDRITPKGSAIVGIDVEAPVDAASIGYRVRSSAGQFADGEQTLIPVLSSSTTVIESTEFYLNPNDSKPFNLTVDSSKDASLTLQYCQNPVWTAVKAMRGIAGEQPSTASALVSKIFSALAAKKIIGGNEDIANAIRTWRDNPSEHALTSMLEKNDALKRLLLDQTPWLQTAQNESQRMAALCQVLEPSITEASLKATVTALEKLRRPDGGFAWASWSEQSSTWTTKEILMTLGIANSLDMLAGNAKLEGMLQRAFDYLVTEALKPKMPDTDSSIALISVMLPQLDTHRAAALIDRTVKATAAGWKKGNVADKAWNIIMLAKKQPETAKVILNSIRQFGVIRPGQGLCFPSINDIRGYATIIQAYALMGTSKEEIDAMRQWVLVQAQATDNLGTWNPDYVIAALLMTGSNWTSVPVKQNVTVDGAPLEIGAVESSTGYFCEQIPTKGSKTSISITPNGVTPSYGSVISIGRKPMSKVKARPGRDLSIDKRVLVERDGQWVETNEFALGERVRVQLTIVAKRNLEYVSIDDERPATFEPVEQLPGYVWDGGLSFYRENLDASTRLFITWLSKGTYHLTYDMTANVAGSFISGIATIQSQLAPELTAHSSASTITVK